MGTGQLIYYLEGMWSPYIQSQASSLFSNLPPVLIKRNCCLLKPTALPFFSPTYNYLTHRIQRGFVLPASTGSPFPVATALVQAHVSWFLSNFLPLHSTLHAAYTPCTFMSNTPPHLHHFLAEDFSAFRMGVSTLAFTRIP